VGLRDEPDYQSSEPPHPDPLPRGERIKVRGLSPREEIDNNFGLFQRPL